jgi:hypothetical protein
MFKVNNNDLDNIIKKIDNFSLDVNNKILDNNNQLKISIYFLFLLMKKLNN